MCSYNLKATVLDSIFYERQSTLLPSVASPLPLLYTFIAESRSLLRFTNIPSLAHTCLDCQEISTGVVWEACSADAFEERNTPAPSPTVKLF